MSATRPKSVGVFHLPGGRRLEFRAQPISLFQKRGGEIVFWVIIVLVIGAILVVTGFVPK